MSFEFLGLSDAILQAVSETGYTEPTPIQRQAIPAVLQGRDVLGIAQTGTGKTAGFTLPMIDILAAGRAKARMPRSLILEPTRELAAQVSENFELYGKHHKLTMALLIGGVSFADQEAKLERGADVLIATPGRLLDHFERGKLMLNGVKILVVDESDRMLDMGFIPDVERICSLMPKQRQTLFFSATMPSEVKRLTDQFLIDPKVIEVAPPASAAATVTQKVQIVAPRTKSRALKTWLAKEDVTSAIVFCNRKRDVATVHKSLKTADLSAGQLHGDMSQPDRMATLQRFKDREVTILVASDVAARGLDISAVSHVFNYDVPNNPDDYVHRIGRTGRAGRSGVAVTLATPEDERALAQIEKTINAKIERIEPEKPARTKKPAAPAEDPAAKAAPPPEPQGKPKKKKSKAGKRDAETDHSPARDPEPVGWGDHVPAFLLRGTRRSDT
ncbi:MAG: DEAD/DEAH box helicase [Rhodothalassiaceae bacterium]